MAGLPSSRDLESWISDHASRLPDFLDMPDLSDGLCLCKRDLVVMRRIAEWVPGKRGLSGVFDLASCLRLLKHGFVIRRVEGAMVYFDTLTPLGMEVLKHNASFRIKPGER